MSWSNDGVVLKRQPRPTTEATQASAGCWLYFLQHVLGRMASDPENMHAWCYELLCSSILDKPCVLDPWQQS
jgi:hypothetical protein